MSQVPFAILSEKNLENNFSVLKSYTKNSSILGMVKANAYGHGIRSISLKLDNFGIDGFGVARIDEAIILREKGIKKKIVLAEGIFTKDELFKASIYSLDVVFHSSYQINLLYESSFYPKKISAWFKVDSGMSRLGFRINDDQDFEESFNELKRLCNNKNINDEITIISHLASSSNKSDNFNNIQFDYFNKFINFVDSSYLNSKKFLKSICNSDAIFNFPDYHFDIVRSGIGLYGYSLINSDLNSLLKPVMKIYVKVIDTKILKKGDYVGYDHQYECKKDSKIAILSCGYGDGFPSILSNIGYILNENMKKFNIIGKISMDMMVIDISNNQEIKIGDFINLIPEGIIKDSLYKSNIYKILTLIQNRVKCYWID